MTVSTEVTRVIVEGNASTTTFSYSFPIPGSSSTDQTNAELLLLGTDSSITVLADNLCSITGIVHDIGDGVGGTFTYPLTGSPVNTGSFLTLNRIVPYTQTTVLPTQGGYSPAVVMNALDWLALQTEQLNTWSLQSVRAPITDDALSDLPTATLRAGSFLYFDPINGDVTTASSTSGMPSSILVGTNSTSASGTTELLLTGSAVASVATVGGVTTATLTGGGVAPLSGAVVYLTINQTSPSNTTRNIAWDAAQYDTDSFWSAGSATRLTVPATGYYVAVANIRLDSNATIELILLKNGAAVVGGFDPNYGSASLSVGAASAPIHATAGDYFELDLFTSSAINMDHTKQQFFSLYRVG